ncbi:signal peptidase II [Alteromonas gracilis]
MQAARGASLTDARSEGAARPRLLLFILTLAVALAADQVTKYLAEQRLSLRGDPIPLVGEVLQLKLAYNPGAAFSTGTEFTWVFTTLAIVASVVIARFALKTYSAAWAVTLGVLAGGVIGNLIDRLFRDPGFYHGHVVDFLMLPNWPIFNIADICINVAAGLIVLHTFRGLRLDGTRESEDAA